MIVSATAKSEQAKQAFLHAYTAVRDRGGDRPWLAAMRERAIERFADLSFPTRKNEDWKYTNVAPLFDAGLDPAARPADIAAERVQALVDAALAGAEAPVLVFAGGRLLPGPSRVDGEAALRIESLADAVGEDQPLLHGRLGALLDESAHGFAALNAAFVRDGACVTIAEDQAASAPVHLVFIGSGGVTQPRNLIVAEPGSRATVIEHYIGATDACYLTNAVTEIELGRGASLTHIKVQRESAAAFHVVRIEVKQEEGSTFSSYAVGLGARLSRTELRTRLQAPGAQCELFGLYAVGGRRHCDHHTMVDHAAPRTSSVELYKGIVDDGARGVFTGHVLVRPDAQKIDASQSNKNLLLADGAVAETRPQLEIYADDVKCSHGATVGRLDEEALFYMRARGIGRARARAILTGAFAAEVLERLPETGVRAALTADVRSWLDRTERGTDAEEQGS